jgi:hypothetical protein
MKKNGKKDKDLYSFTKSGADGFNNGNYYYLGSPDLGVLNNIYATNRFNINDFLENLKPRKVIFNPPYTICYFQDNGELTKEVVKCSEWEIFDEEEGVAMCIVKRVFKNRSEFVRIVNGGHHQLTKNDWTFEEF